MGSPSLPCPLALCCDILCCDMLCCAVPCCAVLCHAVLCCAESLCCVQAAGLQVVVDQEAIDRAVPLLPGTRMTLPLMLHSPQVCCTHTASLATAVVTGFASPAGLCSLLPASRQPVLTPKEYSGAHDLLLTACMIPTPPHHLPFKCNLISCQPDCHWQLALYIVHAQSMGQGSVILQ